MVAWSVLIGFVGGMVAWARRDPSAADRAVGVAMPSAFNGTDRPTPAGGRGERLRPEVDVIDRSAPYVVLATWPDSDRPVTYDPCRPIDVVVNPDGAPDDFVEIVTAALAEVSAASGLHLEVETFDASEDPSVARTAFQPNLYGDRWSPVLIAWTTPDVVPDLDDDVAGIGGSASMTHALGGSWYLTGVIYLDAEQLGNDAGAHRAVLLHELGHLLGLDHSPDPAQLMYASSQRFTLNTGDLAGFAAVGAGDCSPRL